MQAGCDQSNLVDREQQMAFFSGRRGNPDGDFTFACDGKFGKLTGLIGKALFIRRVQEDQFEGF